MSNEQWSLFYADCRDNHADNQNEWFQVIIHPNSKFRSSLGLEIVDKNWQFRTAFLDLNIVQE